MSYPTSEDKKIQKLSNILTQYAETQGLEFSFGGQEVYPMETFADFGCLALFLADAKDTYEKIYNNLYTTEELMVEVMRGRKIKKISNDDSLKEQHFLSSQPKEKIFPVEFIEKTEDTYFGFIPKTSQEIPSDFFIISHFSMYSLDEYIKIYKKNKLLLIDGKIPLDPLYERMVNKINSRTISVVASNSSANPDSSINNIDSSI